MKITDVKAIVLKQDNIEMIGDGSQDTVVIMVTTDEGITGVGEVDSSPYVVKSIIETPASHMACMGLREVLIGEDPLDIDRLWRKMYEKSYYYGRRSVAIHAISGIDMALWDIAGKAYNVPVSKLLGGTYRTSVGAYCSVLMPPTQKEIEALVQKHMPKGYRGIKFGWGALGYDYDRDIQLAKWARAALGDKYRLMLDIGMLWTDVKSALYACRQFEQSDVYWVEEPFRPDFIEGYRRLCAQSALHISAGEEVGTVHEFKELIDNGCVDIMQPDISRCGGLTIARKLTDMCEIAGINIIPHAFKTGILMSATLQYIASLPHGEVLEFCEQDTVLRKELITEPLCIEADGTIKIPQKPGLGFEIDMDVLNKYSVNA